MDDYIIKSSTTSVAESVNILNQAVSVEKTITEVFSKKLTCTQGMSLMKKLDILDIQVATCSSNTDIKIFAYIVKHHGQKGFVTNGSGKPIGINELAKLFNVSRKKVSNFISELISNDLIYKHKRILYVNPYMNLPYGNSGSTNHLLQLMWDDKYQHTYDEVATVEKIDILVTETKFQ